MCISNVQPDEYDTVCVCSERILLFLFLQVPLEILPKSETKHEDMISILDTLHQYVPTTSTIQSIESIEVSVDHFHYTLFGGDMLTTARARGSKKIRSNSERGKDRLEGLLPVTEDWHAKVCLLSVRSEMFLVCTPKQTMGLSF